MMRHSAVRCVIVGGDGKKNPFLILELNLEIAQPLENKDDRLYQTRLAINAANELSPDFAKISDFILLVRPEKPVLRSKKDTGLKKETFVLNNDDIKGLYNHLDPANPAPE